MFIREPGFSTQREVEYKLSKKLNLAQSTPGAVEELKGENAYDGKDYNQALKWFKKAVAKGNADSQAALGFLYLQGNGVPQNDPAGHEVV